MYFSKKNEVRIFVFALFQSEKPGSNGSVNNNIQRIKQINERRINELI